MVLILFAFVATSHAANFVEILRNEEYLVYIDIESMQDKSMYVSVWEKWIPRGRTAIEAKKAYKSDVDFYMNLCAYKKDSREWQPLAFYAYLKNGKIEQEVSAHEPYSFKWEPIVPGSIGEDMYRLIMHYTGN